MTEPQIKVLLIEDDSDFAFTVKKRLASSKEQSFLVECLDDLASAAKRLKEGGIDVVLLDLNLKDSKGLGTLSRVHAEAKHLPIVVITGEYGESLGPDTLKLGAQDYFLKGEIEPQALARAVRYAIERKRQEEVLRHAYSEVSQLLALVPSVLIRIDPGDRIINWNSVAERVLGIPHKEALNRPLSGCGVRWNYEILKKGITECRLTKRPLRLDDIEFKRPTGEQGLLGVTVNPIDDPSTDRTGILIYGADITERRRLKAELRGRSGS